MKSPLRIGTFSRSASGFAENGDAVFAKEWNGQALLAIVDGLGHGTEAALVSTAAKNLLTEIYENDVKQIVELLHHNLRATRGAVIALARIDRTNRRLSFCGVGNVEARVEGEPPMHPASTEGVVGMSVRKTVKFEYKYEELDFLLLHSDGISSRFDIADFPHLKQDPQAAAEDIVKSFGKDYDDASIIIAVDPHNDESKDAMCSVRVSDALEAATATQTAKTKAQEMGFSELDQTKIAIAVSELALNIVTHANGNGIIELGSVSEPNRVGIIIRAIDHGPGIEDSNFDVSYDPNQSSRRNGLGIGLGSVQRLMDETDIQTQRGIGTTITAKKWKQVP